MYTALVDQVRRAAMAADAGRASESQMILIVAAVLVALTVALIVASPLTNRSRRAPVDVSGPRSAYVAPAPSLLRLVGLVAVLTIVTAVRRIFGRR